MPGSFFCEACGAEVKSGASECPSCGRRFLGVRCPRCGREGRSSEFSDGCPDCGYMTDGDQPVFPAETRSRKTRYRSEWPASRYWTLSALVILGIAVALFFWFRG